MKKVLKSVVPSVLMLVLVYIMRNEKDILVGLFFVFPVLFIAIGIICSDFVKEFLVSVLLTSLAFLIPINLCFNMGTCIELVLIYIVLSCAGYLIKNMINKITTLFDKRKNQTKP